jgi:hypothetical protein
MEEFYNLLVKYNLSLHSQIAMPKWHQIFTKSKMPVYMEVLLQNIRLFDRKLSIIEVGSGYGDIVAILLFLGFKNVIGIERDEEACNIANKKIKDLLDKDKKYIICEDYPISLEYSPDVYIQVNNVYTDDVSDKSKYLERSKNWVMHNGKPKSAFVEFIDSDFTIASDHFPSYVRLTKEEVQGLFTKSAVSDFKTYEYPRNSSSKTLYRIDFNHSVF